MPQQVILLVKTQHRATPSRFSGLIKLLVLAVPASQTRSDWHPHPGHLVSHHCQYEADEVEALQHPYQV
jgi:hypothetical protein